MTLAHKLMAAFQDIHLEDIYALEAIMIENGETCVHCKLIDEITNWLYDGNVSVAQAYENVKIGDFNHF